MSDKCTILNPVPFFKDIKLSHSVFALPFAASAFFFTEFALPTGSQIVFLLLCMVSARTFSMGMNRYLDRRVDAQNPRTQGRMIPSGQLSPKNALLWSLFSGLIFVLSSFSLSLAAGLFSFPLLVILSGYSFTKKFTSLCHWYLGGCLALSPIAVAVALNVDVSWALIAVSFGIIFWTSGFDLLYAMQDLEFDKNNGYFSFPAKFGLRKTLYMNLFCFAGSASFFVVAGLLSAKGPLYFCGIAVICLLLAWQHYYGRSYSKNPNKELIQKAFYSINAWVSPVFLGICILERCV